MKKDSYSIITVSYNSEHQISKFISSVLNNTKASELIIIDNNSQDKTTEIVSKFSQVRLIKLDQNLGFSKANNLGANVAQGEYLVFLNPDSEIISEGSIEKLVADLERHPELGLVGPRIIHEDQSLQKTVRNLPTLAKAFDEYILNKKGEYDFYDPGSSELSYVETIVGAGMVIKKDLFLKVRGFNEKFFLYYEDIDLCRKVLEAGLTVGYDPKVVIRHVEGASSKNNKKMLPVIRTLSWFIPMKSSGSRYYMVQSAQRYHGVIIAFIIKILMLLKIKYLI